jgi:predicted MPP superfamily phosphohydrolase
MRFFGFVLTVICTLYLLDLALLAGAHRVWWRQRWVKYTALTIPLLVAIGLVIWGTAHEHQSTTWIAVGAGLTSILFAQLGALLLALLIAAILRGVLFVAKGASRPEQLAADADRRRFLRAGLAAIPLMSATAAAAGTIRSAQAPAIPRIPLMYPDLPPDLEGLRILQLSDMHVGPYVGLDDVERLLQRAAALEPDLVVVTGDICDHLPDYLATLQCLEGLSPRLGTYASLGNHEYFRGVRAVRACFDQSSIPLLVDQGITISVGAAKLHVTGADDPRFLGDDAAHARLRRSVEASLDGAPADAFQLLMSHRSQAFDTAAPLGVQLTLSGHTHGFQLGFGGRSLFESWLPEKYIWGHYGGGATQLYTSAGVGHWFPFRLGCPPEAPLFTLTSATPESV